MKDVPGDCELCKLGAAAAFATALPPNSINSAPSQSHMVICKSMATHYLSSPFVLATHTHRHTDTKPNLNYLNLVDAEVPQDINGCRIVSNMVGRTQTQLSIDIWLFRWNDYVKENRTKIFGAI